MAGNRMEAYANMHVEDFFSRTTGVPFEKAAKIIEANRDSSEAAQIAANRTAQKIQEEMTVDSSKQLSGWSMVEIKGIDLLKNCNFFSHSLFCGAQQICHWLF